MSSFCFKILHQFLEAFFHFFFIENLLDIVFPLNLLQSYILLSLECFCACKGFSLPLPLLIKVWVHVIWMHSLELFSRSRWPPNGITAGPSSIMIRVFGLGLYGLTRVSCSTIFSFPFCDVVYFLLIEDSSSRTLWIPDLSLVEWLQTWIGSWVWFLAKQDF